MLGGKRNEQKCRRYAKMRTNHFLAVATAALAFCVFYASVGLAATEQGQPDVKTMTMDELLNEFHHPPGGILPHPPPQRRIDVINALRKIGDPLIEKLKDDLRNSNPKVKTAAAGVLMNLGEAARPAVPEIVEAMNDADEDVRASAVRAVSHLKDPRAFYALVNATHDPSPRVRYAVLQSAHPCLSDAVFAVATVALSDNDSLVRKGAIYQLKMLKDKRAVPFLIPLLEDIEIHHYNVKKGIKTANRNCDEVVLALEHILKGRFMVNSKGTQEENDLKVKEWRQWWKEHGDDFKKKLYAEPELRRPMK